MSGSAQQPKPHPVWRWLAAILFIGAGIGHFVAPQFYIHIVPPSYPAPRMLVIISGVCEIAGGLGLLLPPFRRLAGWGLIALLLAVYPANFYMAFHPAQFGMAPWVLWARLPFQIVFIAWVWFVAIRR